MEVTNTEIVNTLDVMCCPAKTQQITKLNVSTCKDDEEILKAQGYKSINVNLNQGTSGHQVFLWFKKESDTRPVTRIEFSFSDKMKRGLLEAGYEQVNRDLNAGVAGDHIFLWYFYDSDKNKHAIPIVDLKVSKDAKEEPALMRGGWERLGCDLNRNAGGNVIYLWVKREKPSYIQDIEATADFGKVMFEQGYTCVGEDTNRGAGGDNVFLWYRRTTDKKQALTALNISISHLEEAKLQKEGYTMLHVNLNEGTSGTNGKDVYAWYKKGGSGPPIQAMVLLINCEAWKEYQKAGINFIQKNLNEGNDGCIMHLAYK